MGEKERFYKGFYGVWFELLGVGDCVCRDGEVGGVGLGKV